jgi:peptidyl-tRNA hydrolase, PTH1 family
VPLLVVGLGNPGPEYEWTPHNLGFHVLDELARRRGAIFGPIRALEGWTGPRHGLVAHSGEALLLKPQTWMNASGEVVAPLAAHLGVQPAELLVVHDDIDLPAGTLRLRPHGGAGGHKGMRSIIERLGSDRFPRLRVGVGRPRTDAARHVLSPLAGDPLALARIQVDEAAGALEAWLAREELEQLMSRFHSRWTHGPLGPHDKRGEAS